MDKKAYKGQLLQRINEVLQYIWDPIGVREVPEAYDEYISYADTIWRAVLKGQSKAELSAYLTSVTTERMGLDPRPEHDDKIAAIILDWARFLKERYES